MVLKTVKQLIVVINRGIGCKRMKYVKSTDDEFVLDDGENILYLRCKLDDAKKEALKAAEKNNKVVTINKTVGYIDPDL